MGFTIARLIAIGLLIWAVVQPMPYDFYTLLRFVVCGVTAFGAFNIYEKSQGAAYVYGGIALLFNPFFPIHLSKDTWQVIDIITVFTILLFIIFEQRFSRVK